MQKTVHDRDYPNGVWAMFALSDKQKEVVGLSDNAGVVQTFRQLLSDCHVLGRQPAPWEFFVACGSTKVHEKVEKIFRANPAAVLLGWGVR